MMLPKHRRAHSWLHFWGRSILGWELIVLAIVLFPMLGMPGMVTLAIALTCKAASMIYAIWWIWNFGKEFSVELHKWELETAPTEEEITQKLYDKLREASHKRLPFGVFDFKWFSQVDHLAKGSRWSKSMSTVLKWTRIVLYRFEALMVLSTLALIYAPYPRGTWTLYWLAPWICFAIALTITAMAIEVLFGNLIMGPGYDRYCHRHLKDSTVPAESDGHELLISVGNFARLAGFSLLAVAAVFQSLHAQADYQGFAGTGWEEFQHISPYDRLRDYGEFAAFTMTTFATVGYGDVHPDNTWTRICVGYLHVLGMGMILVMLQLLLNKRDWPTSNS